MFATLSTAWMPPRRHSPAIAGTVGEAFGWRYVFLGLLPLIGLAGALTLGALHAVADAPAPMGPSIGAARRGRLPLAIVVALGSGLLTVGLTTGELMPTVALSATGLVIGLFAFRRLTPSGTLTARPVLPAAILLRGILTCAFFAVDAFVALTLVGWRGLSATEAGFALTAATISWTAGSWVQARGATRWPTHRFVRVGFAVVTIGLSGMLLVLRQDISWLVALGAFGVAGFGMGLAYSPLALIVLREASPETHGIATSSLSLTESLGTAFGTGLSGALVAASVRTTGNPAAGLAVAFTAATVIGLGGVALSGRLRPREVPVGSLALTPASPPS